MGTHPASFGWIQASLALAACTCAIGICIYRWVLRISRKSAEIDVECPKSRTRKAFAVCSFLLALFDIGSCIFYVLDLHDARPGWAFWFYLVLLAIILLSSAAVSLSFLVNELRRQAMQAWMKSRITMVSVVCMVSIFNLPAMQILTVDIFGLAITRAPPTDASIHRLHALSMMSAFMQSLQKLLGQLLIRKVTYKVEWISLFVVILSALSLLLSLVAGLLHAILLYRRAQQAQNSQSISSEMVPSYEAENAPAVLETPRVASGRVLNFCTVAVATALVLVVGAQIYVVAGFPAPHRAEVVSQTALGDCDLLDLSAGSRLPGKIEIAIDAGSGKWRMVYNFTLTERRGPVVTTANATIDGLYKAKNETYTWLENQTGNITIDNQSGPYNITQCFQIDLGPDPPKLTSQTWSLLPNLMRTFAEGTLSTSKYGPGDKVFSLTEGTFRADLVLNEQNLIVAFNQHVQLANTRHFAMNMKFVSRSGDPDADLFVVPSSWEQCSDVMPTVPPTSGQATLQ
mmetsp:Transcript_65206/g.124342  ORF Transcript_65206/g.124342 Transcript_65206/m.124342 type:complete len:515 (-) Transcript_65206:61-1605(-)